MWIFFFTLCAITIEDSYWFLWANFISCCYDTPVIKASDCLVLLGLWKSTGVACGFFQCLFHCCLSFLPLLLLKFSCLFLHLHICSCVLPLSPNCLCVCIDYIFLWTLRWPLSLTREASSLTCLFCCRILSLLSRSGLSPVPLKRIQYYFSFLWALFVFS